MLLNIELNWVNQGIWFWQREETALSASIMNSHAWMISAKPVHYQKEYTRACIRVLRNEWALLSTME